MTKPPELLPCPFCGGHLTVGAMNVARCKTDECALEHFAVDLDWPEKVAAWNTRTPDPAVKALVEAARALQSDMLERAQAKIDIIHGEQYRIVNAGRSAWSDFCAALAAFDKTTHETKGE